MMRMELVDGSGTEIAGCGADSNEGGGFCHWMAGGAPWSGWAMA
ncbi:MAG: hypothetical protein ACOCVT_00695 [bacterium]